MTTLLGRLRNDHRDFEWLLDRFEQELATIDQVGNADIGLLEDILL